MAASGNKDDLRPRTLRATTTTKTTTTATKKTVCVISTNCGEMNLNLNLNRRRRRKRSSTSLFTTGSAVVKQGRIWITVWTKKQKKGQATRINEKLEIQRRVTNGSGRQQMFGTNPLRCSTRLPVKKRETEWSWRLIHPQKLKWKGGLEEIDRQQQSMIWLLLVSLLSRNDTTGHISILCRRLRVSAACDRLRARCQYLVKLSIGQSSGAEQPSWTEHNKKNEFYLYLEKREKKKNLLKDADLDWLKMSVHRYIGEMSERGIRLLVNGNSVESIERTAAHSESSVRPDVAQVGSDWRDWGKRNHFKRRSTCSPFFGTRAATRDERRKVGIGVE